MKQFLLYLWQLPQNILGRLISLFAKKSTIKTEDGKLYTAYVYKKFFKSSVSLGNYVIIDKRILEDEKFIKHEHGHQIQSLYLGPLYLIIIGIPSACGNLIRCIIPFGPHWYYNLPWEKWADKLGGVERHYH